MTGFTQIDANTGVPAAMANVYNDFGWEYVWHCHILGHEENDFMRPVQFRAGDVTPDAPTGVAVNGGNGNSLVSWTDPTPGYDGTGALVNASFGNRKAELGFRVERATVVNGTPGAYTAVGTVSSFPQNGYQPSVNTLANATSYTDTTPVVAGEDYSYRVVAVNTAGETASGEARLVGVLNAPSGLTVTGDTASSVSLSWVDNAHNETAYLLGYSTGGGAVSTVNLVPITQAATVPGLLSNTAYDFTITAKDFNGNLAAAASGVSGTTAPVAVTALTGSSTVQGQVNLSWTNGNNNLGTLTSVVITGTMNGAAIAPVTVAGPALAAGVAQLTGLPAAATYNLTVTVTGAGGSASASVSGKVAGVTLVAATGMAAQLVSIPLSTAQFALSFNDLSQGETGYQLQVCLGGSATNNTQCLGAETVSTTAYPGTSATANRWYPVTANVTYTLPASTGAATALISSIAVQNNNSNGRYSFRVAPLNSGTTPVTVGPVSTAATITLGNGGTPVAPTLGTSVANVGGTATLTWADVANNNASYTIQSRRTGSIANITLTSGGSQYTTPPTVTIAAPNVVGGVQATAHAVVTGGVVSILVDNPGSGYTGRPAVNVTGGNRNAGGANASSTGTANSTLGGNTWTTAYANVTNQTPATLNGLSTTATVGGLIVGSGYQFQIRSNGVGGNSGNSAYVVYPGIVTAK
jgi:hypothetical protein